MIEWEMMAMDDVREKYVWDVKASLFFVRGSMVRMPHDKGKTMV